MCLAECGVLAVENSWLSGRRLFSDGFRSLAGFFFGFFCGGRGSRFRSGVGYVTSSSVSVAHTPYYKKIIFYIRCMCSFHFLAYRTIKSAYFWAAYNKRLFWYGLTATTPCRPGACAFLPPTSQKT